MEFIAGLLIGYVVGTIAILVIFEESSSNKKKKL
jgi:gas vesicle protein